MEVASLFNDNGLCAVGGSRCLVSNQRRAQPRSGKFDRTFTLFDEVAGSGVSHDSR